MKHALIVFATLLSMSTNTYAGIKTVSKTLKKEIELKIDREGGANGANVVWHPTLKRYYAAMAGNVEFPLFIFDAKGNKLSGDDLTTMFDVRGFWYNPKTKTLQMNGYNDFGWGEYALNSKGIPESANKKGDETGQPTEQSAGVYDAKTNTVYFFNYKNLYLEGHKDMGKEVTSSIQLYPGARSQAEFDEQAKQTTTPEYNETSIVYTGIKGAEIAMLNITERRVELYNMATGYMADTLALPDGVQVYQWLNFGYTNGIYFFFNKETRTWHGYKA